MVADSGTVVVMRPPGPAPGRGARRLRALCCVLGLWLVALRVPPAAAGGPARITQVERYGSRDAARVVLYATEPVTYQLGAPEQVDGRVRVHIEVPAASYAGAQVFEMKGLVERVRVEPRASALRVTLELSEQAQHQVFFLPEPFRLVIDVARHAPASAPSATGRSLRRIALDPGHGGTDIGATGRRGVREKDVALDIAHRAAPLLARELGISTLLTRDTDTRVALEERVAKANAFGADLFVSIHCNAEPRGSARGAMSFVLDGSHDHRSVTLLERENAAPVSDSDGFSRFLQQFDGAAANARSTTFARLLQRSTLASLVAGYPDALDLGVRGAGFYVLAGARMPAVLFETAFLSNELEERRLGSARYRQKLADAIVNAARAYRSGY